MLKLIVLLQSILFLGTFAAPCMAGGSSSSPGLVFHAAAPTLPEDALAISAPAISLVYYGLATKPEIVIGLPKADRDRCVSGIGSEAEVEAVCQSLFRAIVEGVKAFLVSTYGMERSLGQFDPTTITYSRDMTLSFLAI